MKVVLFGGSARVDEFRDALRAFPGVDLVAADAPADLRAALAGAEILLAGNRRYTPENAAIIRAAGTSLRWIQFTTSGIDKARDSGLPPGVVVTNMAGMRAFAVAEHAMFLMLGVMRNVRATEKARAAEDWCRDAVTPSLGNLAGKHLVVIGLGAIAREVARKAKAFDMKVSAVTRSTETVDHVDALLPRSALCAACAQADIVLLSALYDDSADKMFGREAIAAMRPSAVFVNIARGRLVDEAALVEALAARRIAGAGIDVAVDEPLPPDHAFWHMDNVLLTPHVGGAGGKGVGEGAGKIFAENLRRWIDGQPLARAVIIRTP